jgi:hypothetical protein
VGGGPAFSRVGFFNAAASADINENRFGWMAHTGFAFLNREFFFAELAAGYQRIGNVSIAATTLTEPFAISGPPHSVTLPATTLGYSLWNVGISLGLKLP